jgi:DNA-binding transcriptional regulator YdaS (Cro superfamily)
MFDIQTAFSKQRGLRLKVARALGITHGAVSQWRRVPAERVIAVEALTGFPKERLRPDLYPPTYARAREAAE